MKFLYSLAALALLFVFGLPFSEYNTEQLLPIETLQVAQTAQGVHLVTEIGEGAGADWASAVENLRKNAPGDVFFDTAEEVIFCGAPTEAAIKSGLLRPSAQVYFADALQEPEGLHAYLSAHPSPVTVADLRAKGGNP